MIPRSPFGARLSLFGLRLPFPQLPRHLRAYAQTHSLTTKPASTRPLTRAKSFPPVSRRSTLVKQSSLSLTAITVALCATALGLLAWTSLPSTAVDTRAPRITVATKVRNGSDIAIMDQEIREGWPGNLTPEHEAKLKEFWEVLLKISGRMPDARPSVDTNPEEPAENGTAAADTPTKKKKRFGMFRRGNQDDDASSGTDSTAADPEDKYGQTKEYKQALADQTPEQLRDTIWSFTKADNPDALLLRFLRARKWNVQNALVMMVSTTHWRSKDVHLDDELIKRGEAWFADKEINGTDAEKKLGKDFMAQLRMGKSFVHGTDLIGRPMCFVRVRLHKGGEQGEEAIDKFTVYTIETARMMLREPVDTAVIVFDMTGFSMANMDYTPVKFMIKVFEANYPESLGAICVHKAPWLFQGIWTIIKGWLDPVVASKITFTKDVKDLEAVVPANHIPKEMGGREEWEYKYIEPVPGENHILEQGADSEEKANALEQRWELVDEFEQETMKWCHGEGGEASVKRRHELSDALRTNYWRLDPFVRAKTLYDREGVISEGGKINMYPDRPQHAETSADDID